MGIYFGTDGVRGIANKTLTPEIAYKLGRIGGYLFKKDDLRAKVLIGRDTRISGPMFEGALIAGLLSSGAEVMRLGVITTPGVAYLTKAMGAHLGIMISASHNPFEDNGIKLFGPNGMKLSDEEEAEVERLLNSEDSLPRPIGKEIGTINDYYESSQKYLSYLQETIDNTFEGLNVGLDCANGSTSSLAALLFANLEADIYTIGNSPNGTNINDGFGSTHPEQLQKIVVEKGLDVGLAFDGDGDRLIAVDEKGNIVDGDKIMYICATYLHERNMLPKHTVVATVMSNLGLYKALENKGIDVVTTKVGDRYVLEKMLEGNYALGGEQSGHIIFLDHLTSGDGMLTGVQLLNIMVETGKPLSELAAEMPTYPQVLKNVPVENKDEMMKNETLLEAIRNVEEELGESGRVLVRPSGTESLIRVMVEAETEAQCEQYVNQLVETIESLK
ncbi:MAG: phosphoglucosamine mutase [Bacilli bacterium]|nr:phosphoglucosamine mutase [Bacilli bacterium]